MSTDARRVRGQRSLLDLPLGLALFVWMLIFFFVGAALVVALTARGLRETERDVASEYASLWQDEERQRAAAVLDAIEYRLAGGREGWFYAFAAPNGLGGDTLVTGNVDGLPDDGTVGTRRTVLHVGERSVPAMVRTGRWEGSYLVLVGRSLEPLERMRRDVTVALALGTGVATICLTGAMVMARRRLERGAATVTASLASVLPPGQLSAPNRLGLGDEMDRLAAGVSALTSKLAEQRSAVELVSAGIAHEFRRPSSEIARLSRTLPQSDLTSRIGTIAERMARLAASLTDLAAIGAAYGGAEDEADLDEWVEEVEGALSSLAEERGVRIELSLDGTAVRGTPLYVERMIENLVRNAIQASPVGGRVVIRTSRHEGRVFLEVLDQGRGFESGDLDEVVLRAAAIRAQDENPPVGLRMVKGIAVLLGGVVRLNPGEGGHVTVSLPDPSATGQ